MGLGLIAAPGGSAMCHSLGVGSLHLDVVGCDEGGCVKGAAKPQMWWSLDQAARALPYKVSRLVGLPCCSGNTELWVCLQFVAYGARW